MNTKSGAVDIICDLTGFKGQDDILAIWDQINKQLIGKNVSTNQKLDFSLPQGQVVICVIEQKDVTKVEENTQFNIIDVRRSPDLLFKCKFCKEERGEDVYGPYQCAECGARLCEKHAHLLEGFWRSYCPEHKPICQCRHECQEPATFRCESCNRLFGEHFKEQHPKDDTINYCRNCWTLLFGQCSAPGCNRLGRSKCAYLIRENGKIKRCNAPICPEHSYQWKILGPHNRGITLCKKHREQLSSTYPEYLLLMITAPQRFWWLRNRIFNNTYRLLRIINSALITPISYDELLKALVNMEDLLGELEEKRSWFQKNYWRIVERVRKDVAELPNIQLDILSKIKSFYQRELGYNSVEQIIGLKIEDYYYLSKTYRVVLHVTPMSIGRFIGKGGASTKKIKETLNLHVVVSK